jgi:hypothetical protein
MRLWAGLVDGRHYRLGLRLMRLTALVLGACCCAESGNRECQVCFVCHQPALVRWDQLSNADLHLDRSHDTMRC